MAGFDIFRLDDDSSVVSFLREVDKNCQPVANSQPLQEVRPLVGFPERRVTVDFIRSFAKEVRREGLSAEHKALVGETQLGRFGVDRQVREFNSIKTLNCIGGFIVGGENVPSQLPEGETLFLDSCRVVPLTDQNSGYGGNVTLIRDDYEFTVYPAVAPLRGVRTLDFIRFRDTTNPPKPTGLTVPGFDVPVFTTDGTYSGELADPNVERSRENMPTFDAENDTPVFDWSGYVFWQITRILDVPAGFQAFFTKGIGDMF